MNAILVFGLIACVAAAGFFPFFSWESDRIHDHRFEYHPQHDVLLILTSHKCWIVDVDHNLEDKLNHHESKLALEDELYAMIKAHTGEAHGEGSELRNKYHDTRAFIECLRHDVYHLKYTNKNGPAQ